MLVQALVNKLRQTIAMKQQKARLGRTQGVGEVVQQVRQILSSGRQNLIVMSR